MPWDAGTPERLFITRNPPADTEGPGEYSWELVAGRGITWIHRYDSDDDTYMVGITGIPKESWVPADWIEQLPDLESARRMWQIDSLTEAERQIQYAAAFQRLLWRELSGSAVRKRMGETVTIKPAARTIERAFPSAWNAEWYAMCWGKQGHIVQETREIGQDGELHRGYRVDVLAPTDSGFESLSLWWLGEDLEA